MNCEKVNNTVCYCQSGLITISLVSQLSDQQAEVERLSTRLHAVETDLSAVTERCTQQAAEMLRKSSKLCHHVDICVNVTSVRPLMNNDVPIIMRVTLP